MFLLFVQAVGVCRLASRASEKSSLSDKIITKLVDLWDGAVAL